MRYSEKTIKRIVNAIEKNTFHTFCNVHIPYRFDDIKNCEICFETVDGYKMCFIIFGGEIDAMSNGIWCGSCVMKNETTDTLFMWIGCKLDQMYKMGMDI